MSAHVYDLAICGAGISGLAVAHFARRAGCRDLLVLEAADRPGGKVQTEWLEGFCCEWGPQGFLDNVPETLELAHDLGLDDALCPADERALDRFIVRRGRLRRVPLSPPAFLRSDVLSLSGRLRVLGEPFQRRGPDEESVRAFAMRRIGREAADVLVDAMVTGVYAGDPAALSLPATFPRMREMERVHGSLVKAMIAKARARRRQGGAAPRGAGPAGPGGTLTTFARGMQQLTDSLAASLGDRVRLGATVTGISRHDGLFVVGLAGAEAVRAHRLVVALPPYAAASVLPGLLPSDAIDALRSIPAVKVAVVMTGYRHPHPFAHPCRGFGFLVPGGERRKLLGTIFCDSTFPPQAPPGCTLLRSLVGGARAGELAQLGDVELVATVRRELAELLGGDPEPDLVHVIRHDYAIPQYTLGHLARLDVLEHAAARVPGLTLTGNGLRGIALNSCVAEAKRLGIPLAAATPPQPVP